MNGWMDGWMVELYLCPVNTAKITHIWLSANRLLHGCPESQSSRASARLSAESSGIYCFPCLS